MFYTLDEYFRESIDVPTYNPCSVVIVLAGGQWVGMVALSDCREKGFVFREMTGVKRRYRGRSIAVSLKVLGLAFVRECGVDIVRTVQNPDNSSIISLNKSLGYVEGKWDHP